MTAPADEALAEPIAIIGMSARLPGAATVGEYWTNLVNGVESVRFFTRAEQAAIGVPDRDLDDPNFVAAAPVLDDVDRFDAGFFGMTPREAELRDPQQRLFLELSHTALEDAGYDPSRYDGEIGVYGGVGPDEYQWKNILRNPTVSERAGVMSIAIGNHPDYLATIVAYTMNLRGPALTVHSACSTSMVAIHLACEGLRNAECDMALAGGASIELPPGRGYVYNEGGIISPDGHCRPFDANSAGTIWGSGGAVLTLKRLSDAVADGDHIRAVILGDAVNNDGADKVGFAAPSVNGQAAVIAQALGVSGVDPRTITYVEAHGTGTALGDPIEVAALTEVFGRDHADLGWCALGSVKGNIGHLGPAAGAAGVVKAVLALEHRVIPPMPNFDAPHPDIDFANSPFYVNATLATWDAGTGPRRAGVSSFGIGGTNGHLILEEAPEPGPGPTGNPRRPVRISARTETARSAAVRALSEHLATNPDLPLTDVVYTLDAGRGRYPYRAALVGADTADVASGLLDRKRLITGTGDAAGHVAFLFPGQGAQYAGMGAGLYRAEPVFRSVVDHCAEVVRAENGIDLRDLLFGTDRAAADAELARTENTQPALFTVSYALATLWESWGVRPDAMIGHSIGEYVAATLAGVFEPDDALRLVIARGALMGSVPPGAMLAVRADEADIRPDLPDGLSIATINGPGTCVVAGPAEPVAAYAASLADREIGAKTLRTSHAFHSPMMDPILAGFRDRVAGARRSAPTRRFLSNLTGTWITGAEATDPDYWARHLREAVRFGDCVRALLDTGPHTLLEVGPGRQLIGLARLTARGRDTTLLRSLPAPGERGTDVGTVHDAAARLWVTGVPVEFGDPPARRVPLPTYPFERSRYWIDPVPATTDEAARPDDRALPPDRWFSVPTWRELPATPTATEPERCLLFGAGPRADRVTERLRAAGHEVIAVRAGAGFARDADGYTVAPDRRADYDSLVADLAERGGVPAHVAHCYALDREPAGGDVTAAYRSLDHGFFSLLGLVQAIAAAPHPDRVRLDVVTTGAAEVTGADLTHPEAATAAGAALVLPLELSWLSVRHIDTDPKADSLSDELLREATESVALRGRHRWSREYRPITVPTVPTSDTGWRDEGVYLITGGLGGVGITVAEDLARRVRARLVLLSRTPLPDRVDWEAYLAENGTGDRAGRAIAAIRRAEDAGGQVSVEAVDVTDPAALRGVRERILANYGRLDGIVHAAGVPGGGVAEVKDRDQALAVFAPKVAGTLALAEAFGDLPLDIVALCSSATAIAGGFGQLDYCAANAYLDAYARSEHGFSGRVVSVDWGGWKEVGMAAEVAAPTAFKDIQDGARTTKIDHPVVTELHRPPGSDGSPAPSSATGTISPATHWVLDEHRLAGRAVMPGTGHLESVRAAATVALPGDGPVELRDVVFIEPLAVPDDGRAVYQVAFTPGTDGMDFQVTSRTDGPTRVHARGTAARANPEPAPVHDRSAILARCRTGRIDVERTESHSGLLAFGPRWANLRVVHQGPEEDLALLTAPEAVRADLPDWTLHPAILDEATSIAVTRGDGQYLPIGYGRILVRAPLPATVWSHLRYHGGDSGQVIVADVTLFDDDGTEVASIGEFMVRRIDTDAVARDLTPTAPAAPARVASDESGIAPVDGADALRRIVAADAALVGPQVVVTVRDVRAVIARATSVTQDSLEERLSGTAATGPADRLTDGDYTPPGTDLERTICALWEAVLGVGRVGVDDDFFELGGNSLVAVQLISQIRSAVGERLPMRSLFESPTVAGMAATIDRMRSDRPAEPDRTDAPIRALPRVRSTN